MTSTTQPEASSTGREPGVLPLAVDPGTSAKPGISFAVLLVLVVLIVSVAHWPVLSAGAVSLDDGQYLFENHVLQNPSWTSAKRVFTEVIESSTVEGYYEPLALVSLMGDVALGGRVDRLRPFHRTNLTLHVLNTALVTLLLYMFFGRPFPAALVGLLFGVHPLTVEPVAWVWERKTLLAAFFALWCLVSYVRFARRPSRAVYGASLAMFVLALLAKPTTTPLPAVLVLMDFWPLRRLSRRTLWEKVPFFAVAALSAAVTIISTHQNSGVALAGVHSVTQLPLRICYLLIFYLGKIVWPARLSSVYVLPESLALSNPLVLGALAGTLAVIAAVCFSLLRTRAWFSGWWFFVLMISPTLGVIGYSWVSASDKYLYLPAIGLLIPSAWLLSRLWDASASTRGVVVRRTGIVVVVLTLSAAETVAARRYLTHWHDSVGFFQYMSVMAPHSPQLRAGLGDAWARQGQPDRAIECYMEALQLQPGFVVAHMNLGEVLSDLGRLDEAIRQFGAVLQISPGYAQAHNNLAVALARVGKADDAIEHLAIALQLRPKYLDARRNLAVLLARMGRNREAITQFSAALQLSPNEPELHNHIAVLLMTEGMPGPAIDHYRRALRAKPNSPGILRNLAWVLATTADPKARNPAEAVSVAERACALGGDQEPAALDTLAAAYAAAGRFDRAVPTAQRAFALATATGKKTLAEGIGERLQLYAAGIPFRDQQTPSQP